MKTRPYSHLRHIRQAVVMIAAAVTIALAIHPVRAEEKADTPKNDPIRIDADKLVIDNQKRSARFSGNAKATQGDTVITADSLTIFRSREGSSKTASTGAIQRIEATGHVKIEFDNKVAVSDQAVYIMQDRKLVLTGPDSKVMDGQNEIVGSKITFFRDSGNVEFGGDGKGRVKALIHSDQRGLN